MNRYIQLMEKTLGAYTFEHIIKYFEQVKREGLREHGFPRLTANIGILISYGRRTELLDTFVEMMDFCCEQIPKVKAANDFSVKEIIFCIMALEKSGQLLEKTQYWRECLKGIEPTKCYTVYAKKPTDKLHNWACFTAVSEYMRQYAGLCDSREFIDIQIPTQLAPFEENGMYRDPNNPMVYDLVPRGLFAILLHFGYDGKYREQIDALLKKSGMLTMKMQSVTGEIPFGGRSNGFLHNEAHFAIVMEYEAQRYFKAGDIKTASTFKAAASLALDNIEYWLSKEPIRHIKNRFPTETKFGCEDYAYFDKYMITTASFLYAAYLICNDKIPVGELDSSPRAFSLSNHFHKTFLKHGDYFLEFDTNADPHYDCNGLGRVHKKGAPSTLCISTPCSAHPNIVIDPGASDISLAAGYVENGRSVFAVDSSASYEVKKICTEQHCSKADIEITFDNGVKLSSTYIVSNDGVAISVIGAKENAFMLPVFVFDGENTPCVQIGNDIITVKYEGYTCKYTTNGKISATGAIGCNRNGRYKAYQASADGELKIFIEIYKG